MLRNIETLLLRPIMETEIDLRNDEDSEIKFSDEIDGAVLQMAGNGCDVAIRLDDEHLQTIVDQLAEWGWKAT